MDTMYLVCALVGGTLITCQFLMTLFGMGADHDMAGHDGGGLDGGHDVAGHGGADHAGAQQEAGHGAQSSWFFGMLTFRTLSAAVAFFGLTGLAASRANFDDIPVLVMAVAAGVVALFLVGWLMQSLSKLNVDGTVRIERSVGSRGTVYVPVPAARGGVGKVHVSLMNRTMEWKAITSQGNLPTGTKVVVVSVVTSDTVEVSPTE